MFFKKKKKEEIEEKEVKKDDSMSKIIDEVLNEQASEKEAAMKSAAEQTESLPNFTPEGNSHVTALIEKFAANPNNDTFKEAFNALLPSTVLVPMLEAEEQNNGNSEEKKFHPGLIQNDKKEKFMPAFTEKSQIPEDFAKKFTMVSMSFSAYCNLVSQVPECEKLLVNPFTKQFVANANIAGAVAKSAENGENKKQFTVNFATPEPETEEMVKMVTEHFKEIEEIEKSYFSKMTAQEKTSYVFIIDCPKEKHQDIFKKLIDFFKEKQIKFDISLMLYEPLKQVVDESKHITQVYTR